MSISVSIIEDDQNIVDQLITIFGASSLCRIKGIAVNGEAAQQLIVSHPTDVFLVDLGLPDADGVDLVEQIKRHDPHAHILVLSTFGDAKHITRSIAAGARGYLLKDEINNDLIKKIVALHNGGSPLSPAVGRVIVDSLSNQTPGSVCQVPEANVAEMYQLSPNEVVTFKHLCAGLPITTIAAMMCISPHTVNQYLRHLYRKLNVHSRAMAVAKAQKIGFNYEH